MTRYYRLDGTDGGPLPADYPLPLGTIIRVPRSNYKRPGYVFNTETREWVKPVWVECENPMPEVSA